MIPAIVVGVTMLVTAYMFLTRRTDIGYEMPAEVIVMQITKDLREMAQTCLNLAEKLEKLTWT